MNRGPGWLLAVCWMLLLVHCGLGLQSRSEVVGTPGQTTASPTPTPTSGPTAAVSGSVGGSQIALDYVLLNTDSNGNTALEFLSYDPCLWVQTHSASTFPQDFNTLIVYLQNTNAALAPGTYTEAASGSAAAGMSVASSSSFGSIVACTGSWTGLAAGSTVTLTGINSQNGAAAGSISAVIDSNNTLSGTFNTTNCTYVTQTPYADDSDVCTELN